MLRLSDDISHFRKHAFPLFFLVAGVILIYFNSLDAGFQLDDQQIIDRPSLHVTELNLKSLKKTFYWSPQQKRIYRPLPCLTLGINYYLGNVEPFGYHVVNVSIHILCAISVYVFLLTLLSIPGVRPAFATKHRYEISVIATFLFAFHPIQTNVATYIIQRMTSMAALFYIISVTGYFIFRINTLPERENSVIQRYTGLIISILSGICALLSKENTAMLPVVILIADYLLFFRNGTHRQKEKLIRIYIISIIILLTLFTVFGLKPLLLYVGGHDRFVNLQRDFTPIERLLTESRVVFLYLYLLLIPDVSLLNLNHDIAISKGLIDPPQTILALFGILFLVIAAFFLRKKHNLLAFAIVWYFGNLVIESTVIPLELIFEHRTYLPGIVIFFLMSLGIVYVSNNILRKRKTILFVSILLFLYSHGTHIRNVLFKNPISMWLDVVDKSPNLARGHSNLGNIYRIRGYEEKAIEELEKAIELKPTMIEPHLSLGQLYLEKPGMEDKALKYFKRGQRLDIYTPRSRLGLGHAYMKFKDYKKAEHFFYSALQMTRYYPAAINNLGVVKISLGQQQEAEKIFKYGIKLDPSFEEFSTNLATLHLEEKRFSEAIQTLETYLKNNQNSRKAKVMLKTIREKAEAANAVEQ